MAFWGVELKSGKPFSHLPDAKGGARLHVSQATLGFGTGTNKSVVQCNVGNRSPVFLCSLFPEKSESSQLNLEFEETDEVVFSVIGPRSVHLTGYFLGASRNYKLDDESESFGEDIVDTETERSPGVSDEEYDDSFINDDDDLQVIPPSPAFSDGVSEEILHEGRNKKAKANHRRLRKKFQLSQTDDDDDDDHTSQQQAFSNGGTDIMDSEGEDMTVISSLVKSAAKNRNPEAEEKAEKDTSQTIVKKTKASHDNSAATEGKTDAIVDSEPKRKPHEYNSILPSTVKNGAKPKKKLKKHPQEEKEVRARVEDDFFSGQVLTWDKAQENEMKDEQPSQDTSLINGDANKSGNEKGESLLHFAVPSDFSGIVAKIGKRKKKQTKETKVVEAGSPLSNVNGEDQTQADKARCENVEQDDSLKNEEKQKEANDEGAIPIPLNILLPSDDLINGIVAKTGKRTKKQAKKTKALRADIPNNDGSEEDQAEPDGARCEIIEQDSLLKNEENEKHSNDEGENSLHLLPSDEVVHGIVTKGGKRKKKQAKGEKSLGAEFPLDNNSREDQAQIYEATCENIEEDSLLKVEDNQKQAADEGVNPVRSDELVHGIVAKTRKRKKKQPEEEKAIGVDSTFSNFNGGDQAQLNESRGENIVQDGMLKNEEDQKQANIETAVSERPSVVPGLEPVSKPKKKRKTTAKDKALESDANNIKIVTEDTANRDEQNQMQTIDADFDNNDDQSGNENHNGKKNKKSRIQENEEALNMDESMNTSALHIKENNVIRKSKRVSKAKKQDGKVAAS